MKKTNLGFKIFATLLVLMVAIMPWVSAEETKLSATQNVVEPTTKLTAIQNTAEPRSYGLEEKFKILQGETVNIEKTGLSIQLRSLLYQQTTDDEDIGRTAHLVVVGDARINKNPKREITIDEGYSENLMGYEITYTATSDGEVPIFYVKRHLEPLCGTVEGGPCIFEPEPRQAPIKQIRKPTIAPTEHAFRMTNSEGMEEEYESFKMVPGQKMLRAKQGNAERFEEVHSDLQEGMEVPVGERMMKFRTDKEQIMNYVEDGNVTVQTRKSLRVDTKGLYITNENGEEKLIKVMPSTASEKAIAVLGEKFDDIEIKDMEKPIYELNKVKKGKFLGFIPMNMKYQAHIDADTGDVLDFKRPWYKFLTSTQPDEAQE
jgi:uncharacterized membrane protein YkoI